MTMTPPTTSIAMTIATMMKICWGEWMLTLEPAMLFLLAGDSLESGDSCCPQFAWHEPQCSLPSTAARLHPDDTGPCIHFPFDFYSFSGRRTRPSVWSWMSTVVVTTSIWCSIGWSCVSLPTRADRLVNKMRANFLTRWTLEVECVPPVANLPVLREDSTNSSCLKPQKAPLSVNIKTIQQQNCSPFPSVLCVMGVLCRDTLPATLVLCMGEGN